ncbi:hypothetical protein FZC66_13500 [Priestia megaterium]|nr:hypothetical protein FZC66_13500 [Priestia megaterium]
MFGVPIQSLYLYTLIAFGSMTFIYILFSDVIEGMFEGMPVVNPTLIFSFFTLFSACGYIFELIHPFSSILIMLSSIVISLLLVTLLNIFVLIPLSSAEESIAFTEQSLTGRLATVITSIPPEGFGEIMIEGISGTIAKPAISFKNVPIPSGTKVLIVDIKQGNALVVLYNE